MFNGCTSLTSFSSDLSSLEEGDYMFNGCSLDTASVQNIADTINDLKSQNMTGVIHIGHADDVPASILWECGNKMLDKGWTVYFNEKVYSRHDMTYSITKSNGYIPNASEWQNEVYKKNNLIITEITKDGRMINND